jgi:hypothetical protein
MKPCRECRQEISEQAYACPHCGTIRPAKEEWNGWGFEYKTEARFLGLPLLHISFKYRPNRAPVAAKGIVAIGQFGVGIFTVSQFGVGIVSVSQFTVAGFALAQFAFAWRLVAQIGVYIDEGRGQLVWRLQDLLKLLP